ncbi:TonB-dependent receptor plug domain-containing protein [Rhodoferax sp.]|uniref:TonB-dependent receptor plug domain-containing protein n=1 Tax=Rhodoferax sp. TaxID=50421 RepID=UPI002ACE100C|nr:TonB-dependent receptor [Rhodoferax sp.]MDZ7920619.1 TonB-dependent receptor [Rhodoferax sp.]
MTSKLLPLLLSVACAMARAQSGSPASAVSERDFLGEVPVVLSVSRLAQPLDEAPGAVTILDRQFIRMSGARDVADLLRMVPGFQTTTSFETDAPLASYHGRSDDWANRIQVLVDGRSVYSGHLQGSAGLGLQTLALNDIARIEVLRGSNSAAYGARAFLGVVNIVSRDVRETVGSSFSVAAGDNGVADAGGSLGWGGPGAAYRISMDSRGDSGLRGAFGRNRVSRMNASAAFDLEAGSELDIRLGALGIEAGRGTHGDAGNAARMRFLGSQFLQADWHTPLGEDQDLLLSYSHTENTHRDSFPYLSNAAGAGYFGIPIDLGGQEVNDAFTLQHTVRASEALRAVWGLEARQEVVSSPSSFDVVGRVVSHFSRLFGNLEWRVDPKWVINAGAMGEHSSMAGGSVSPRLMLNWHALPGHTLRAGVSSAFRPPSAYEKYAAVRYYDVNGQNPITTVQSNGVVGPEKIFTRELGYNLSLDQNVWSGDLRLFEERITDGIERPANLSPEQYQNIENFTITGAEYQMQWRPALDTQIFLTQTWTDIANATRFKTSHGAARYATSLALMHTLPGGLMVSLMHQQSEDIGLMSGNSQRYAVGRTDARVAKALRIGLRKAELALTVQNLDQAQRDGDRKFFFDRRAFVSLRMDY